MSELREDVRSSGGRPALAGLLHGMQGEASRGDDHRNVPEMREYIHISVDGKALAEILPKMQAKAMDAAEGMIPGLSALSALDLPPGKPARLRFDLTGKPARRITTFATSSA